MSLTALLNGTVYTAEAVLTDRAVLLRGDRVLDVVPDSSLPADIQKFDLAGGSLAPGFIDVQVNGGGGVQFDQAPTPETIKRIGAAHRRFGTTGFLPTLISSAPEVTAQAVTATRATLADGVPGVLGLHLEGPYLSVERRGAHAAVALRPWSNDGVDLIANLTDGVTVMTLAPDVVPPEAVRALFARGVRISLGHSEAPADSVRAALEAGATGFTHLFNAMGPLAARAPGMIGTALGADDAWCSVIVDGHHVDDDNLRLAYRAKPRGKLMLITDAMAAVGTDIDRFALDGRTVEVADGVCRLADGTLAGSVLDMAGAVRNCVHRLGVPLDEALRMAATYPAAFLGLDGELGRIAPGYRASLTLLDSALHVRATWIDGAMMTHPS